MIRNIPLSLIRPFCSLLPKFQEKKALSMGKAFYTYGSNRSFSKTPSFPLKSASSLKINRFFHTRETPPLSSAYQEMTKRVALNELKDVETKIATISASTFDSFLIAVGEGNWKQILSIFDYPLCALKALKEEKISPEDFATIVLPSASLTLSKRRISLFSPEGEINPVARTLLEETFLLGNTPYLTKEQVDLFFELLKKESPIQQHFFLEDVKTERLLDPLPVRTRINSSYLGFNFLSQCHLNGTKQVLIPSLSMMNCLLRVLNKNPITIHPVLGLSTPEQLEENAKKGLRDVAIRFLGITLPDQADGFRAEGTDFTYHDFFHAFLISLAPPITKKLFLKCAEIIKNTPHQKEPLHTQKLEKLACKFIDMEFFFHFQDRLLGKNEEPLILFLKDAYIHFRYNGIPKHIQVDLLSQTLKACIKEPETRRKLREWISHLQEYLGEEIEERTQIIEKLVLEFDCILQKKESLKKHFEQAPESISQDLYCIKQTQDLLDDKIGQHCVVLKTLQDQHNLSLHGDHLFQQVADLLV